jgi:hypothetical protein
VRWTPFRGFRCGTGLACVVARVRLCLSIESGSDVSRFAPQGVSRSPWQTVGYGVHRVFKVAGLVPCGTWLPSRHHRRCPPVAGRTAARWGEMPERSCGYGLSSRPPDVHLRACAQKLVFEDPRSDRARMRKASANTTLLTFGAVFPDTFQSVGPAGCPTELPLLGLSKDRPSVVLTTPKSTPGRPLRDCLRNEPARARSRSVLVVSTTSTACSFDAMRVYCNALPTLGFTPFQHRCRKSPCVTGTSSECLPCPPKPSLRPKLPPPPPLSHANVRSWLRGRQQRHQRVATLFTATLAPSPFPFPPPTRRYSCLRVRVQFGSVGPRGFPPRTGPLRNRRLPADHARCSPGLARTPSPALPRTAGLSKDPRERQRPQLPTP